MTRPRQTITHLKAELLNAHPANVREDLGSLTDLARSIREHGILQPITVTEHHLGGFLIHAGHRRFAAGRLVGVESFPAIIRHGLDDRAEQLVVMLVENTQRRDLNPVERAQAYGALVNQGLSQTEIARRVGCTPATINHYLTLLDLDPESLEHVREGTVNTTDAVQAVRDARQHGRKVTGMARRGRPPTYFGETHRLASVVRRTCQHPDRSQVGNIACGECWEQAIVEESVAQAERAS